jgi:hypothetical protein
MERYVLCEQFHFPLAIWTRIVIEPRKPRAFRVLTHFDSAEDPAITKCADGKPSSLMGFIGK